MSKIKVLGLILVVFFGALLFVYGGKDDSPGAQLLGALIAVAGVIGMVRKKRRTAKPEN